jgi:NADH-quinone oxidoreductase subunit C
MAEALLTKEAVFEGLAQNVAIQALRAAHPEAIVNAKFDRNELTLVIAPESLRDACRTLQQAGYNFFEDVTCVDWYPSEPRFQVTYHILSHRLKERVRSLRRQHHLHLAIGQFLRTRSLGPLRSPLPRASQSSAHYAA